MKHPVLTRVFAIFLAVLCLIMLFTSMNGLRTAEEDKTKNQETLSKLLQRIENYQQLSEQLAASELSAEEYEKLLEEKSAEHEELVNEHLKGLGEYTATKGGLVMGDRALREAEYAIHKAQQQYDQSLAAFNQYIVPYMQPAGEAAADCTAKAKELEQLIILLSTPVPTPEPTPEVTPTPEPTPEVTPTPEPTPSATPEAQVLSASAYGMHSSRRHLSSPSIPGGLTDMSVYMIALQSHAQLAAQMGQAMADMMVAMGMEDTMGGMGNMGGAGGSLTPDMMQGLSPVEQLGFLKLAFESTGMGLTQLLGAAQQIDTMLDQSGAALYEGRMALGQSWNEVEVQKGGLDDTQQELEGEKSRLQQVYEELTELERLTEEQKTLENKHSSARIILMAYSAVKERTEDGTELLTAANDAAEYLRADYDRQYRQLRTVNILTVIASMLGIMAVVGAFELLHMRKLIRPFALACLLLDAGAYLLNLQMSGEQHYVALFNGLFALIVLLIAGEKRVKNIAAEE